MTRDRLGAAIAEAVAMLDRGPARRLACHAAAEAFDREHGRPRGLITAVGADHVGWCVWAYGRTEADLAGLPGTFEGFPVRVETSRTARGDGRVG